MRRAVFILMLLLVPLQLFAAGGRASYDLDGNGLIEINDLDDLNEIRNNISAPTPSSAPGSFFGAMYGATLYGSSAGCPATGCRGYELAVDLDFDSNKDGVVNASDTYWNGGRGWIPIGSWNSDDYSGADFRNFSAIFEGNGHVIKNLFIFMASKSARNVGLFGAALGAEFRNVGLVNASITTKDFVLIVGSLVGDMTNSSVTNCYANLRMNIANSGYVGGLIGSAWDSTISSAN